MAVNTSAFFVNNPNPATAQSALVPEQAPTDLWGQGTPDGDREPFLSAQKGTLYRQVDASDDYSCMWVKVDEGNDDNDWILQGAESNAVVDATASGLTVTKALHANKTVTLNRAAGIAVVLPAATGSGDKYLFVVGTTFTGAATIKVVGNDIMKGTAILFQDSADTVVGFATAVDSDTIDLLGTGNSTGGILGGRYELIDMAADTWFVSIISDAAGTEATPFSATV
jgi:hypothetical protein